MLYTFFARIRQSLTIVGAAALPITVGGAAAASGLVYGGYLIFCYHFLSFGLFAMAKKRNMKIAFLAWIPVASTYLAGKLAGEAMFFGIKAKWIALVVLILQALTLVFRLITDIYFAPLLSDVWSRTLKNETFEYIYGTAEYNEQGALINSTPGVMSADYYQGMLFGYASAAVEGIYSIAKVFLIYVLFLNYAPRSAWIFTLLSFFFPFMWPILVFVTRKNSSDEYREFMKMKMHSMYGGGNPYAYGDGSYRDPYDLSEEGNKKAEKPESPFGEFDDKK